MCLSNISHYYTGNFYGLSGAELFAFWVIANKADKLIELILMSFGDCEILTDFCVNFKKITVHFEKLLKNIKLWASSAIKSLNYYNFIFI